MTLLVMCRVRREADAARIKTYCATSPWKQFKGLFNGLSKQLLHLSSAAKLLRAQISVSPQIPYSMKHD